MGEKKLDEVQTETIKGTSPLDGIGFFNEFPQDLKEQIASFAQYVNLEEEQEILKQGELNNTLYFLLIGTVGIYVDGGMVAKLSRKGDLLGEMSVITNKPCSATIITKTPVKLLSLDAEKFQAATAGSKEEIEHILYRIYANILSDKLKITNQKAKFAEDANLKLQGAKEELEEMNKGLEEKVQERTSDLQSRTDALIKFSQKLEQKNTELIMSAKKLEEMYQTRDVTFEKLENLHSKHLKPLFSTLKDVHDMAKGEFRESLKEGLEKIETLLKVLHPLTESFSAEKSMKSKKVLLLDSVRKRQVVAKMALGGTGVDLEMADSLETAKEFIANNTPDLVLVETEMAEIIDFINTNYPQIRSVLMTSNNVQSYFESLSNLKTIPNIVSRNENDKSFTIKNIMTTVTKLSSRDIFGLEKYLSWGVEVQEADIHSSDQRQELIDQMQAYFKNFGVRNSILGSVATVLEEILMNAIYDAPTDKEGKSLYNHLPRTEKVQLKGSEYSKLRYASDGTFLAVSVVDPFGSLTGKVILNYLKSCYGGESAGHLNENANKGGAGRGLHQIIENSDLVVFNVSPGIRTEVIALFNIVPGVEHETQPSFHFFVS